MGNPARILLRPFQSRRQRTTTALELSGEWLKLAQVEVGAKGKRLLRLIARPVAPQEELSQTLVDLFKTGMSSADSIVISIPRRSEEHTSELQSHSDLVCRLLLEKKKKNTK